MTDEQASDAPPAGPGVPVVKVALDFNPAMAWNVLEWQTIYSRPGVRYPVPLRLRPEELPYVHLPVGALLQHLHLPVGLHEERLEFRILAVQPDSSMRVLHTCSQPRLHGGAWKQQQIHVAQLMAIFLQQRDMAWMNDYLQAQPLPPDDA